jgi:hypothetical protein
MAEGCAVASVLGMLEEREAAARVRVKGLREEAARLAEVLEAAEIELDRRVIAREELVQALAASAAGTAAVTEAGAEQETAPSPVPVPGSTVPPWREALPVTVLTPDCQRILGVLEESQSAGKGPVKAKEIAVGLGLGRRRRRSRGYARKPGAWRSAGGSCRRRRGCSAPAADCDRARRRLIRVAIDHRITASLDAGRVS